MNKNILKRKLFTLAPVGRERNCSSATSYSCERGVQRPKNSDRATECAMTSVGENNKVTTKPKQPNCLAALSLAASPKRTIHHSLRCKVAFTLAEVLITLGIIGIVTALTLPSLIQKYNDRILVNKFKKMYSIYCQAYEHAMFDYAASSYKDLGKNAQEVKNVLSNYLNVADKGTRKFSVYTLSGEKYNIEGTQQAYLQLVNGGAVIFSIYEGGYIIIGDINSKLVLNKNIFPFSMSSSFAKIGSMSCGAPKDPKRLYSGDVTNGCPPSAIDWILANDNMDYMHCPDKLIWGKKTSCK